MRRDYFFYGLGIRILMGFILYYVGQSGAINDMSEIIYLALSNFLRGINPYSVDYVLHWGIGTFSQPFNYGPVCLLMYLPAMLFSRWIGHVWIGMFVMINIYSFIIAEILSKIASRDLRLQKRAKMTMFTHDPRENRFLYYVGLYFWLLPFGTTIASEFIYAPMLFCLLGFLYRDSPIKTAFFISMAGMAYQLCFLFLPIYAIYVLKQQKIHIFRFIIGCLPAMIILAFFEIWIPGRALYSLFIWPFEMGYVKCSSCGGLTDTWIVSVPKLLYEYSAGQLQIGNIARTFMFFILAGVCVLYLFTKWFDKDHELFLNQYLILSIVLFTLSTNYGSAHYLTFMAIPLFYIVQIRWPDFRKRVPIGHHLPTYVIFDDYLLTTHKLPE